MFPADAAVPQVFDKTKDQKIIWKDINDSWNSVLDLLVYSKCPIPADHRYKTPALRHHYPSWWWHVLFGMALHILRCCKHCVKQFKGTFGSIGESMSVKLPATLNIQPKYVFYTWENTQSLWVPLFCHQVIIDSKWRPKGGEIDIWKLKMSNFLLVAFRSNVTTVQTKHCVTLA